MKPKEKAKELVIKMYGATPERTHTSEIWRDKGIAKKHALIAVDEILNLETQQKAGSIVFTSSALKYWQQVKNEIKQLHVNTC